MLGRDRVGRPSACDTGEHSTSVSIPRLRVAAASAGASGQRPPGVIWRRRKSLRGCCSGRSVGTARADPGLWPGTPAGGVRPVIGNAAVLAGGVGRRGG
jgi:hypothetical protein